MGAGPISYRFNLLPSPGHIAFVTLEKLYDFCKALFSNMPRWVSDSYFLAFPGGLQEVTNDMLGKHSPDTFHFLWKRGRTVP